MKKILVIMPKKEGNIAPIKTGMYFAQATNAQLKIVDFCYEKSLVSTKQAKSDNEKLKQEIIIRKKEFLETTIRNLQESNTIYKNLKITQEIVWDWKIREWILKQTSDHDYDLAIKAGHRTERSFYTPTDWHLIRSCRAPLYLLSEKTWKKKGKVLVALDVEHKSQSKSKLNQQLLETGRKIADIMKAELDCCFIIHIPAVLRELDAVDTSDYTKKARNVYLPKVIDMVKPFGLTDKNIYRDVGDPPGRIVKLAKKLKVDCLVIGSVGRKGVKGKLIGNTAEQVIKHLHTNMLVINLT